MRHVRHCLCLTQMTDLMKTQNKEFTRFVIFKNSFKLHLPKSWCDVERIFEYHSQLKLVITLAFLRLPIVKLT